MHQTKSTPLGINGQYQMVSTLPESPRADQTETERVFRYFP